MVQKTYLMSALALASAGLVYGCAHTPPPELLNARQEYRRASSGPAAKLAPAELYKASQALDTAERSFNSNPDAPQTRDLAYVAERRVEYAEAVGAAQASDQARAKS